MHLMQVRLYSSQYIQDLCWQGSARFSQWAEAAFAGCIQLELVPPPHAYMTVAPTGWGQKQPFESGGMGASAASPVGPPEGAGRGDRGENIKTNLGGPKDQGGRNSHRENHVLPSERLGAVVLPWGRQM